MSSLITPLKLEIDRKPNISINAIHCIPNGYTKGFVGQNYLLILQNCFRSIMSCSSKYLYLLIMTKKNFCSKLFLNQTLFIEHRRSSCIPCIILLDCLQCFDRFNKILKIKKTNLIGLINCTSKNPMFGEYS